MVPIVMIISLRVKFDLCLVYWSIRKDVNILCVSYWPRVSLVLVQYSNARIKLIHYKICWVPFIIALSCFLCRFIFFFSFPHVVTIRFEIHESVDCGVHCPHTWCKRSLQYSVSHYPSCFLYKSSCHLQIKLSSAILS